MTQDQTRHITIGDLSLRLSLVADALGIPAATLDKLVSGEWVAVPYDPTEVMLDAAQDEQVGCCTPTQREARIIYQAMLYAAATEADSHDD